jgi:Asp/Glu/hydantoin racemase
VKAALDPIDLFEAYMKVTGVPTLGHSRAEDPRLQGRSLGLVNGASWIGLWGSYFGQLLRPGVKLVSVGNEAVQLNFMAAHSRGEPCPPRVNIDKFVEYAQDLVRLYGVDAIMITCSTMNRAHSTVRGAMEKHGVPVIQIDEAMMERAVSHGGRILIVATHGPTVESTRALLEETASRMGHPASFAGATVEEAFELLGTGDIRGHNRVIAEAIRRATARERTGVVVLAQLSMTVFKLSFPDERCLSDLGVPVLTSGETGFERAREVLASLPPRS